MRAEGAVGSERPGYLGSAFHPRPLRCRNQMGDGCLVPMEAAHQVPLPWSHGKGDFGLLRGTAWLTAATQGVAAERSVARVALGRGPDLVIFSLREGLIEEWPMLDISTLGSGGLEPDLTKINLTGLALCVMECLHNCVNTFWMERKPILSCWQMLLKVNHLELFSGDLS